MARAGHRRPKGETGRGRASSRPRAATGASPASRRCLGKVLIANRGEIAVRVIRTCRQMGIRTVAVYSEPDAWAAHVMMADEAFSLGGKTPAESYLRGDRIVEVARRARADGVHPGYGFLSENADFCDMVTGAGMVFIGPEARSIRALGDKAAAKSLAQSRGVPTVPGMTRAVRDLADARAAAAAIGYPVLLKAAAGGGGKGMRVARSKVELPEALERAGSEARASFGRGDVLIERYVTRPRHVEMQVLCDAHGHAVWLGERECSIQRRHQKLIEEAPSPAVDDALRARMGQAALSAVNAVGYRGAGTVEFLLDDARNFYFLEVNTRLQVEHPVTEMITGLDLVEEQVRVARGEPLRFTQDEVERRGWAIECRVVAEDPDAGFAPSAGRILGLCEPAGPGVRVDAALRAGDEITPYYDPMIAKVIAWGGTREEASARMRRALREYRVVGVATSIPFHLFVLDHPAWAAGALHTGFVEEHWRPGKSGRRHHRLAALIAAALHEERCRETRPAIDRRADGAAPRSRWKDAAMLGAFRGK